MIRDEAVKRFTSFFFWVGDVALQNGVFPYCHLDMDTLLVLLGSKCRRVLNSRHRHMQECENPRHTSKTRPPLNEEIDLTIPTRTSQSFTGLQKHCCCCDENIPSAELRRWNQLPIACPSPEGVVTVPLIGGSGHFRMLQVPSKASIPTRENRFRQRRRRDPVQFIGDVRQQIPRSCRPSQVSSQTCKEKLIGSCLVARIAALEST